MHQLKFQQYTIINTAGMPDGAKITDLSGNEKTTFGGNETFKVMIPKAQLTKDINVTVSVKAKCKSLSSVLWSNDNSGNTKLSCNL